MTLSDSAKWAWILLLILVVICSFRIITEIERLEGWETYVRNNYGRMSTGATPLMMYDKPCYREPYMWPQTFATDMMGPSHNEGLTRCG